MRKLTALHEAGAKVQTISLGPLKPEDLARLSADELYRFTHVDHLDRR